MLSIGIKFKVESGHIKEAQHKSSPLLQAKCDLNNEVLLPQLGYIQITDPNLSFTFALV